MQTSQTVIWIGKPNAIVHLSLSNSSPIPLFPSRTQTVVAAPLLCFVTKKSAALSCALLS
jgi:hypothetical protein